MYRIFDAHTHSFPDAVASKAVPAMAETAGIEYYHDGTFAGLTAYEQQGGAEGFLMLPIATRVEKALSINAWVRARADEMSARGLSVVPFGSVHPDDDVDMVLDDVIKLGIKGIKLHPEYQIFFADEPRMDRVYRAIFDRGLILAMHAGEDLGYLPPVRGDVACLARMLDAHPDGYVILAHMGGFKQWDRAYHMLAGRPNVWFDTSFAAQHMGTEAFTELVKKHGVDKVLFGTDAPWADFETALDAVMGSGLSENEIDKILWGNAAVLLGLK